MVIPAKAGIQDFWFLIVPRNPVPPQAGFAGVTTFCETIRFDLH
jgi:hypothetical protein